MREEMRIMGTMGIMRVMGFVPRSPIILKIPIVPQKNEVQDSEKPRASKHNNSKLH
jgi:hypothetical protein